MSSTTYRDSEIWKSAMKTAELCCALAVKFPEHDEHDLAFQIQSTAISIPAVIAEGYGRMHRASNMKQLSLARGLAMKLETYLILAVRLRSIGKDDVAETWRQTQHLIQSLTTLIFTLKKNERLSPPYGKQFPSTHRFAQSDEEEEEQDTDFVI